LFAESMIVDRPSMVHLGWFGDSNVGGSHRRALFFNSLCRSAIQEMSPGMIPPHRILPSVAHECDAWIK